MLESTLRCNFKLAFRWLLVLLASVVVFGGLLALVQTLNY